MITKLIYINGDAHTAYSDGRSGRRVEYYCDSTDVKPSFGIKNGDILYLMDWNTLTATEKTAAVARVWIYSEGKGQWLPQ